MVYFLGTFFYLELNSRNLIPLYLTEIKIVSRTQPVDV